MLLWNYGSSHRSRSIIKGVLKNFAKSLFQSLFLNKVASLRPATWLKKDTDVGVLLWIFRNFQEHLLYKTLPGGCFCIFIKGFLLIRHEYTLFSTQPQYCLTFSWIVLQMLFRCCLIYISIIIVRHVLYLLYLCPFRRSIYDLGLFMSYMCDVFFIFIFIYIIIINRIIYMLFFCLVFRIT